LRCGPEGRSRTWFGAQAVTAATTNAPALVAGDDFVRLFRDTAREDVRVAAGDDGGAAQPVHRRTSRIVRWMRLGVYTVMAVAVVLLVASQRSLLGGSLVTLTHLHWVWVPVLLVADYLSRAAVARAHRRLLRTGGAVMGQAAAMSVAYAANAVSVTLPIAGAQLGAAFTFRRFRRAGASAATTTWTLLISGMASTSSFAALLAVAAFATGTTRGVLLAAGGALLAALPGGALIFGLRHAEGRRRLHNLATRLMVLWRRATRAQGAPPETVLQALLDQLMVLRLQARERALIVLLALVNWLADCLCLAAAILAVGAPVPWQGLLLAYLTAAGASTLAITPGGLGTVELALTGALVVAGLDASQALAATLVYRVASLWLPAIAGWITYTVLSPRNLR